MNIMIGSVYIHLLRQRKEKEKEKKTLVMKTHKIYFLKNFAIYHKLSSWCILHP